MSRQLRRVPANWQHPKYYNDHRREILFYPMYQGYMGRVAEWRKELTTWRYKRELWAKVGVVETFLDVGFEDNPSDFAEGLMLISTYMERCIMTYQRERAQYHYGENYHAEDQFKMEHGLFRFEDEYGYPPAPPNPNDYMPYGRWYQLYEEVSEGTPITPPFKTKAELVDWLATNPDYWGKTWTRAQAEAMVAEEWAPSAVMDRGHLMNSQEAVEDIHKAKEAKLDSTP